MRRALVLLLCLAATALFAAQPASAVPGGGSPVYGGYGFYPRVIRLAHNGCANGTVIASVVTNQGGWVGAIFQSTDNGQSYGQIGAVNDPANAGGMCCQTLFELPTAVGSLPAGTLLWAASFGADTGANRRMSVRVSDSTDQGRHWSVLSTVLTSTSAAGLWEPEFTVSVDGHLVVFYSDETDPAHSQKLAEARSTDGMHWIDFGNVVAPPAYAARPGMAVVRQLPAGGYLMSYEVCGTDGSHNCEVYTRGSADGWNWGDPSTIGTRVLTADGRYRASTPTISVSGNTVLLTATCLRNANGSFAAGDGATVLGNTAGGQGSWFDIASPVPLPDPGANDVNGVPCAGYSSPLLGSADGKSFLQLTTDLAANGTCTTYVGSAAALPSGSTGATWSAEASQAFRTPNQQHYSGVRPNGTPRHWWWDSASGYGRDNWATGATGYPVGFVDGTQQHVYARTPAGTLEHYFWDAANNGYYHDTWATGGVAGDPAAMQIGSAQHVWWVDTAGNLQHSWWIPRTAATTTRGAPAWSAGRASCWSAGSSTCSPAPRPARSRTGGGTGRSRRSRRSSRAARPATPPWPRPATPSTSGSPTPPATCTTGGGRRAAAGTTTAGAPGDPTSLLIGDAQHVWALDATGTLQHWWRNPIQGLRSGSWGS